VNENGSVQCDNQFDLKDNTFFGYLALKNNDVGVNTVAIGTEALFTTTRGNAHTETGFQALYNNTIGNRNTANGVFTLGNNTTGVDNTAVGNVAMRNSATGSNNTAIGSGALTRNTAGSNNIALGHLAGSFITGNDNIAIGNGGIDGESATIRIGDSDQSRAFVAGIRGQATGIGDALSVVIDSAGQLGTISSSRRLKQEISDMGEASQGLLELRPVTFRYRSPYADGMQPIEFGLIAEEVAEVFPELVVYNEDQEPESVKYRLLSSLLLNEVQKQNTRLAEQEAKLAELSAQLTALQNDAGRGAQFSE
jgi:hypothetical protein